MSNNWWAVLIEDVKTGALIRICSSGNNEKEAEENIWKHYPKATREDYTIKAMLPIESYNELVRGGLIK